MFQNIVICYGEAAIEVKTMAEGILAVTVFCMFGLDFILQIKQISFGAKFRKIWKKNSSHRRHCF